MGKLPILDTYEESTNQWHSTTRNPDFFVVDDDMYRNSVRVEASSALVKSPLLDELLMLLIPLRDWSVYRVGCGYSATGSCLKGIFLRTVVRWPLFTIGVRLEPMRQVVPAIPKNEVSAITFGKLLELEWTQPKLQDEVVAETGNFRCRNIRVCIPVVVQFDEACTHGR